MKGILGRKLGMTQVFTAEGDLIPVTVIEVEPNVVLQKKNAETDGYEALQLGYEDKKENRANKPELGHAKKAGSAPKQYIREVKSDEMDYEVGAEVKVDIFSAGDMVDVTGISKGKGYTGTIKRYHAHMLPESRPLSAPGPDLASGKSAVKPQRTTRETAKPEFDSTGSFRRRSA